MKALIAAEDAPFVLDTTMAVARRRDSEGRALLTLISPVKWSRRGREGGWDGEISSAGGRNGCFATREFPLALFLIKVHQSRIFLSRFDALYEGKKG